MLTGTANEKFMMAGLKSLLQQHAPNIDFCGTKEYGLCHAVNNPHHATSVDGLLLCKDLHSSESENVEKIALEFKTFSSEKVVREIERVVDRGSGSRYYRVEIDGSEDAAEVFSCLVPDHKYRLQLLKHPALGVNQALYVCASHAGDKVAPRGIILAVHVVFCESVTNAIASLVKEFGEEFLAWIFDETKPAPPDHLLSCASDQKWIIEAKHVHLRAAQARALLRAHTAIGPLPQSRFLKPMIVKTWNENMGIVDDFLFAAKTIQHGI